MNIETVGSQKIYEDNRTIERKVVLSTAGSPSNPGGNGQLNSTEITTLAGGIQRGVYEFVSFGTNEQVGGGQQQNSIELLGGSREVPIQTHPRFANISEDDVQAITAAAEQNDSSLLPANMEGDSAKLYEMLRRKVTHFLAPAVTARVTNVESSIPSLDDLCKLRGPNGVSAPQGSKWILSGISARGYGTQYEVSREYLLIGDGKEFAEFLY